MVIKSTKPRRRLAPEIRRTELLDAAEQLLRRNGAAVRVEDVVEEAGAAKGTLYLYFPTWDDLLEAVRDRVSADLETRASALTGGDHANWSRLLPDLSRIFIDFVLDLGGLHDVLFHSAFTQARPLPPERRPAARIAAFLHAGRQAGAFAPLDPEPTAELIFAAMHQTVDAIAAGANRERSLAALDLALDRIVIAR